MNLKHQFGSLFLITLFFFACSSTSNTNANGTDENSSAATSEDDKDKEKKSKKEKPYKVKEDGLYAQIKTNKGLITVQLTYKRAPLTVLNFISLAEGTMPNDVTEDGEGYYNGLKFHRVVPNFVIQGGDPTGTGAGGPGYRFPDEFHQDLMHDREGTLSMANSGPATNGSQFFITHTPTPHLDFRHSVFGYVIDGMDVVNSIKQGDVMEEIEIIRKGSDARKFKYSDELWEELKAKAPEQNKEQMAAMRAAEEAKLAKRREGVKAAKQGKDAYKKWLKALAEDASEGKEVLEAGDGLYYFITEEGDGPKPTKGQKVNAKYKGTFPGGIKFDEGTFAFELITGGVIEGWHVGFAELNQGSKATLFIPYWYGYGEQDRYGGQMPGYSTLIFDVELLDIK
jgi:peptidylprolyl isomerase